MIGSFAVSVWIFAASVSSAAVLQDAATFTEAQPTTLESNADSCASCHMVPTLGGSSRVTVTRAGHLEGGRFVESRGGGLVHARGVTGTAAQEPILALRVSTSLLGAGYVEALPDSELERIAREQAAATAGEVHGQVAHATALEASQRGQQAGRFGWKSQHSSLYSFAADSLANELGVPNALYPLDLQTHSTEPAASNAKARNGQDRSHDLQTLTAFMRSLEPVPRDADLAGSTEAARGEAIFTRIGCAVCHVPTLTTAPVGSQLPDGTQVPERLGGKTIHPFSDFLLHDIGTGDGIVQHAALQDADQTTANKFRTAPLWGVRYRSWMMHDGKSVTYHQAIERHGAEASRAAQGYEALPPIEKHALREFLNSL